MVARSLEQDGSWSLQSSRGWLMLVGHETSPVQRERRTKATLEAAFDFPAWWDRATREGKPWGSINPCTHSPPLLHLPDHQLTPFLFPVGPEAVLPDTLPSAGTSHPAPCSAGIPVPALVIAAAVLP